MIRFIVSVTVEPISLLVEMVVSTVDISVVDATCGSVVRVELIRFSSVLNLVEL